MSTWPGSVLRALIVPTLWVAMVPGAVAQGGTETEVEAAPRNVIAVVPRFWPPQYSIDDNGQPAGFAIDVMDEVAIGAGLTVTYMPVKNFSIAVDVLQRGDADLIPNSGILVERMDTFAFTVPVETFVVSLFVRDDTRDINGTADLVGRKLAVVEKNIGWFMFGERQDIQVQVYQDVRTALFELIAGQADALIFPRSVLLTLTREIGIEDRIKIVGEPLKEIRRGIRVMKDDVELLTVLNRAVERFVGSPAYQRIYTKWYGRPMPFWTIRRVAWAMGAFAFLLLITMTWWRYRSVLKLNRDLRETMAERTVAEVTLRESEERYQAVVEDQTEMISRHTPDGIRTFVNQAYCRFNGGSRDELIGRSAYEAMAPEELDRLKGLYARLTPERPVGEIEFSQLGSDGNTIWQHWTKRAIFDASGCVTEYQAVGRDITEHKQAEVALIAAKEQAEFANRVKSEFLANMSHELRTPLNAIIGFSEMISAEMLGTIENQKYLEYAADIGGSGHHLLELINDILDLSKIEAGKLELDEDEVDIAKLIDSCLALITQRARQEGVVLDAQVSEGLPLLHGDERRLKQIVINLLANAIKFTRAGGRVSVGALIDESGDLTLWVSDTGIRISPVDLLIVMKVFGQVEDVFSREHHGSGLGLPLSKALAELHDGTLEIESALGVGTTVTLRLPAARAVALETSVA